MTLTAKDVAEITRLLEESSFDELYLELDGVKLSLKRNGAGTGRAPAPPPGWASPANPGTLGAAGASLAAAAPAGASAPRGASPASAGAAAPGAAARATASQPAPSHAAPPPGGATAADPNLHNVSAPLLGTYYRAPKPGAPAYVEVGSMVEEDTIIGIIEVMKLMNTVRAGVRGRVTEILARDGVLVEYGETLLRIAKSG